MFIEKPLFGKRLLSFFCIDWHYDGTAVNLPKHAYRIRFLFWNITLAYRESGVRSGFINFAGNKSGFVALHSCCMGKLASESVSRDNFMLDQIDKKFFAGKPALLMFQE